MYIQIFLNLCICVHSSLYTWYGEGTVSRIDKITCIFCKRVLQKRLHSAKETYNFIDPTDRSHPISTSCSHRRRWRTYLCIYIYRYEFIYILMNRLLYICIYTYSYLYMWFLPVGRTVGDVLCIYLCIYIVLCIDSCIHIYR